MDQYDHDALNYLEGRCLNDGEDGFVDYDFQFSYGDFVRLPNGRTGMVTEVLDEPDDWYYNIKLFHTNEIVSHVPQGDLELDESEV